MNPFSRASDGSIVAALEPEEGRLISGLSAQLASLLRDTEESTGDAEADAAFEIAGIGGSDQISIDPAIARLLPNAYAEDEIASRDFRRMTERGLASRKVENAMTVVASINAVDQYTAFEPTDRDDSDHDHSDHDSSDDGTAGGTMTHVHLSDGEALAWLKTLTDIRLTLGARLGIETDEDADDDGADDPEEVAALRDIFHWLGYVQDSLLTAIEQ